VWRDDWRGADSGPLRKGHAAVVHDDDLTPGASPAGRKLGAGSLPVEMRNYY